MRQPLKPFQASPDAGTFDATIVEPNPEAVSVASGAPRTAFAHHLVLHAVPRPLHVENPAVLQLPGPTSFGLIHDSIRRGHRHGEGVASMVISSAA